MCPEGVVKWDLNNNHIFSVDSDDILARNSLNGWHVCFFSVFEFNSNSRIKSVEIYTQIFKSFKTKM